MMTDRKLPINICFIGISVFCLFHASCRILGCLLVIAYQLSQTFQVANIECGSWLNYVTFL